jgi:YidB-like protein
VSGSFSTKFVPPEKFFGGSMGLLDDMENKAVASMLGGSSNPLAGSLLQMINNHPGGLSGLVQSFHDKGLGDVASSWIGSGQNLPISADQIQHVLGSDTVKQLAAKAGISPDIAGIGSDAAVFDRQAHTERPNARSFQSAPNGYEHSAVAGKDGNERVARGSRRSWAPGDPGAFLLHENVAFRPLRSYWRVEDNRDIAVFVISAGPRMSP